LTLRHTRFFRFTILILGPLLLVSCGAYKQNIMFKVSDETKVSKQAAEAEKNYVIAKNDLLELQVFTNKGERIIDPDFELSKDVPTSNLSSKDEQTYMIDIKGVVKFPLVGEINLEGLTIRQAEEILQKEYTKYYNDSFVLLKFASKRVTVLGSPGGIVIPLVNEGVRLVEVLAMAKGIEKNGKAHNIRVLRGDQVFVADLSTFEGYQKNNMLIEPGDIVYVEPVRKPFSEGVQEYGPTLSLITTLITLIIVITQASN
jgi:polysaccharide biosynthesis/export protein